MEEWRLRRGIPYRLEHDGASLLVGINDLTSGQVVVTVNVDGVPSGTYELGVGDTVDIADRSYTVTAIEAAGRGYADLEAGP